MEFAPSVMDSRKKKNRTRGGNDQSGSHAAMLSVGQRITGSAVPRRATSTTMSGAESRAPLMIERALGDDAGRGASAAWYALACHTRNGARNGTVRRSLADSSLQELQPIEITARPRSIASLITISRCRNSLLRRAKPRLSTVAQARRTAKGVSTLLRETTREIKSDAEAAAIQMGQLIPGWAENRIAAPTADVARAE